MKRTILSFVTLVVLGLPATALADTLTFQAPATGANQGSGGALQFDLDHHQAYTWRIDNVDLAGKTITGATLTFTNISNWDSNTNMLFIHLLDSAKNAGVASFQDAPTNQSPVTSIFDNFAGALYTSNPLVNAGTANTFLASPSFTTTPGTFVYTFTTAQLSILSAYFANQGNIAFGIDPDCHFWNNGITFKVYTNTNNVPEPTTLALLGTGIGGYFLKRRRRKQAEV